ncbi:Acyl-thioesterase 1 [Hyphodiscus hymeniophilus]|uniref:Acyl-thioesterase 1 n=1 Tax=Hyphodiscus hymeniophilus TaxID=353542 RepID=A0A9P6VSA3_9HELO|nr:Acyl-thioesterase 1 [Hyphodiscus hymeniophilus]
MPSKTFDTVIDAQTSPHVVIPKEGHTHTMILLHGGECTASQFAEELFESQGSDSLTLPEILPSVKWVFPNSGIRNNTRFDVAESQWFDLWSSSHPQERKDLQIDGLRESITHILNIIRSEAAIVPPERIILGGISQGCATAIHALLYGGIRLGGFIGLSGWLPLEEDINIKARWSASNFTLLQRIRTLFKTSNTKATSPRPLNEDFHNSELAFKTPVFLSHSKDDDVVPWLNGDMLWWRLEEDLGMEVEWRLYEEGGHWVNEGRGVDDIVGFLGKVMV